ncbi:MAG: peptidase M23, partial [Nitrospinaceae bacterium]|nr:peptidase M23 [Nitrospinaceae bacterium]NIR56081.1 peptidase M23 [Nitrospinaceae bacterium]NIS86526.1 peptidase M23 [Nitrospinaceae bacterium]NIT85259.1 peptidase M23 [Nitrospinaceae bacterium]NIU45570.1 peptidase M23 [Nitrospinaceae bacterium]
MRKDEYTIMVFPGAASAPKKIRVPKRGIRIGLAIFLVLAVGLAGSSLYYTQRYFELLEDQTEITKLRREAKIQKIQVEKFAKQVKNFETEMARLERFENKLRVITALEDSPKSIEKNWGVGGPYGLTSNSFSTSLEREAMAMVDRLSHDLEQLNKQVHIQTISFQELDEYFKNQKSLLSSTPSIW